jgi:hypothetical protein
MFGGVFSFVGADLVAAMLSQLFRSVREGLDEKGFG